MRKFGIQKLKNSSGDTIIEVMLSMALLTAFLFISWGITNKATQIGINSRKRVDMVNAMKEQAEIIKAQYANDGYKVDSLIASVQATTLGLDKDPCTNEGVADNNIFYFTNTTGSLNKEVNKKALPDASNSLWAQYKPSADTDPKYYDFYIRACWQTIGSTQNTDNAQFIVRLNRSASSVIVPPDSPDPPTVPVGTPHGSGTWTLAYGVSHYAECVVNTTIIETYDATDYLNKIEVQYQPKRCSGSMSNYKLWLRLDGSSMCGHLFPMFGGGATPTVKLNGTTVVPSANGVLVYESLGSAPAAPVTVVMTGFENAPENYRVNRLIGVSGTGAEKKPHIRRFNTVLTSPSGDEEVRLPELNHPTTLSAQTFYTSGNSKALFVPLDDWKWNIKTGGLRASYPYMDSHWRYIANTCVGTSYNPGGPSQPYEPLTAETGGSYMWWHAGGVIIP